MSEICFCLVCFEADYVRLQKTFKWGKEKEKKKNRKTNPKKGEGGKEKKIDGKKQSTVENGGKLFQFTPSSYFTKASCAR